MGVNLCILGNFSILASFHVYAAAMTKYYTDREFGERPRASEEIGETLWRGLCALIETRIDNASFGFCFPLQCPDGRGPCG